jgi:hypothetical protein
MPPRGLSWQTYALTRTRLIARVPLLVQTLHLHLLIVYTTMADNPGQLSISWRNVLFRSALVFVATCITIAAIPVLFAMFILVAILPESFSNLTLGDGTIHIRLDLDITNNQLRAAHPRARQVTPLPRTSQDNQPSSPQSPQNQPAYTWVRQYHSRRPAPLDTAFAAQQPYTWRAPSGHLHSHANILNSLPPYLPPISEPEPIPNAQLPLRYEPYTYIDPSPPIRHHRRRERAAANFSRAADDRIPPARPDEETTPSRPELVRRTTAESMPGQVPMVDDESGDEALPVYDRPPEYDDEVHSQPSPR